MSEKQCTKCNEVKPFINFYKMASGKFGLQAECKDCISIRRMRYRTPRRKELSEAAKTYRKTNATAISAKRKSHYIENRDEILDRCSKYAKENRTLINERIKQKKIDNPSFRLLCNLRNRVTKIVSGVNKSSSTLNMLGCSIEKLRKHLESQFTEGMSWDNYGLYGWHVDHIMPCASFDMTDPEQQKECFHYTNLQPLWAEDNLRKSDRLNYNQ